jgi:hypothetical protein
LRLVEPMGRFGFLKRSSIEVIVMFGCLIEAIGFATIGAFTGASQGRAPRLV